MTEVFHNSIAHESSLQRAAQQEELQRQARIDAEEQRQRRQKPELYLAFGRRSGKTRLEAAAAVHAWAQDYEDRGSRSASPPRSRCMRRASARLVSPSAIAWA